ncbi:MAG TPA: hypothetical protein DD437_05865 [Rhodobiaceae bacterium]|jgi:hypothetical protein|nr:hypothetical protein [Parvibaculum sp.]HBM88046.1 hypothetical protein [Rhodobiaceae bacterium]|tara:strand:- start:77 stop:280 length:204 start_codon:yes stop_codon:yes gene_type:complete
MITANLKQMKTDTDQPFGQPFAYAKEMVTERLKSLGIEDATDLATSIGYLVVGAYGITMILNLTVNY